MTDEIGEELRKIIYAPAPDEIRRIFRRPGYFTKIMAQIKQEDTMVSRATGSQSTKTVPKQGQNKPVAGGKAGAGDARGTAKLPTISRTTTKTTR
jgi:hypothetical protein